MVRKQPLGLYIHVPFCQSKCAYCDFYSMPGATEENMQRYTDALLLQMQDYSKAVKNYSVDSVFIGGGTPTALPVKCLSELLEGVRRWFELSKNVEFTLEANPATVSVSSLTKYRKLGVNRLSMGLQSANNDELSALSRIHTRSDFDASYAAARKAGFENINVDIMYAIPMQTPDSWSRTLDYVTSLEPEHISMYGLKIEEGTPFGNNRDSLLLPDEDTEVSMYFDALNYLKLKGYRHYEISNLAKPGYECRHNLKYWNCDEYLGLGPAAHSYFGNSRFSFKRDAGLYMDAMESDITGIGSFAENGERIDEEQLKKLAPIDEFYSINPDERIGEYIMLRLRLTDGISASEFAARFGKNFDVLYGRRLQIYIDNEFMTFDGDRYALTPKGMFVSSAILANLLEFDGESHIINSICDGSDT